MAAGDDKGVGVRVKVAVFLLVQVLAFVLLDVAGLREVYVQLKASSLDFWELAHLRRILYRLFLLKGFWLAVVCGLSVGFAWWLIRPYRKR